MTCRFVSPGRDRRAAAGGRLISLWAARGADAQSGPAVYAAYWIERGLLLTEIAMPPADQDARYPGLETLFPSASRMQRAASDLYGVRSTDPDQRPWLHHKPEGYDFLRVEGGGVHEIAVGPVHAGTIEPGQVRPIAGTTSRRKVLEIDGLTPEQIQVLLG